MIRSLNPEVLAMRGKLVTMGGMGISIGIATNVREFDVVAMEPR